MENKICLFFCVDRMETCKSRKEIGARDWTKGVVARLWNHCEVLCSGSWNWGYRGGRYRMGSLIDCCSFCFIGSTILWMIKVVAGGQVLFWHPGKARSGYWCPLEKGLYEWAGEVLADNDSWNQIKIQVWRKSRQRGSLLRKEGGGKTKQLQESKTRKWEEMLIKWVKERKKHCLIQEDAQAVIIARKRSERVKWGKIKKKKRK